MKKVEEARIPLVVTMAHDGSKAPVLDRHGKQIHAGDRLRARVCTGRYGQTAVIEGVVPKTGLSWGSIYLEGVEKQPFSNNVNNLVSVDYDFNARVFRCQHTHVDYEHGHETWAEII